MRTTPGACDVPTRDICRAAALLATVAALNALAACQALPAASTGRTFYVATDGVASNTGAADSPLDLASALSAKSPARPGDTIFLRGGRYTGAFASDLKGTPDAPIVVREAPGEQAIIDSSETREPALLVRGAYSWFWGLEIMSTHPRRVTTDLKAEEIQRGAGVVSHAPGAKFINLIVHDMRIGVELWSSSPDSELYGTLIYNSGWDGPDRSHGHGVYTQNREGVRRIADNIVFNQFGYGIHAYGSSKADLNDIQVEGNVVFNNGALSDPTRSWSVNILIGGGRVANRPVLKDNYTFYSEGVRGGGSNQAGISAGCTELTARGNYFANLSGSPLVLASCPGVVEDNELIGASTEQFTRDYPRNTYQRERPAENKVIVRPNHYEPGRAHIIVYNWQRRRLVNVDLANAGLRRGAAFELRDAQDYCGAPVLSATYTGEPVAIPMRREGTVAKPYGDVPVVPTHTGPDFAVFVLLPVEGTPRTAC